MVLAAGLGTRLRPLTDCRPKPLVPVGDRPALAHVLDRLRAAGVRRLVVNAHHRAADVAAFVRAQPGDVLVSDEVDLLGTAGGIAQAAEALGPGDVIVWNADILADIDVRALAAAHTRAGAEATLVVQPLPAGAGKVGLDATGRVVRLRGERVAEEASGAEFLGVHALGASLRALLPPRGCIVGDVYIPALRRGALLRAFLHTDGFWDIGSLPTYLAANVAWLASRGVSAWTGERSGVDPQVVLEDTVVGDGAILRGAGRVERCVVWPGERANAPLADAVVAGGRVVDVGSLSP
jgi:mannose-1-phosphate guanylyltransferase